MRSRLNSTLVLSMFLILAACSPATPTSVQVPELDYSLNAVTGVAEIDSVLAAVANGDRPKLVSLIKYMSAPCTNAEGFGGPPKCREGEVEGTVIDVLPFLGSEGHHLRKDEIDQWQGVDATGLYAIYRVAEKTPRDEYFPAGDYAVILKRTDGSAISLRIADGGIVRVDDLMFEVTQESLEALIQQDAAEVILEPKFR